jgi:hypothetical protein
VEFIYADWLTKLQDGHPYHVFKEGLQSIALLEGFYPTLCSSPIVFGSLKRAFIMIKSLHHLQPSF